MSLPNSLQRLAHLKKYNNRYGRILDSLGLSERGKRVVTCSNYPVVTSDGYIVANRYCHDRFCPICMRLKSLKVSHSVTACMRGLQSSGVGHFAFFTVTVPNVSGYDLGDTLRRMSSACNRFDFKNLGVLGYVRSLEVTYNPFSNTFHPHFHFLLHVDDVLYEKILASDARKLSTKGKRYPHMETSENPVYKVKGGFSEFEDMLREKWRKSFLVRDFFPQPNGIAFWQCDIRAVVPGLDPDMDPAAKEVAKYIFKITVHNYSDNVIATLMTSLKGVQQFSYSGSFRTEHKRLRLIDDEYEDQTVQISHDIHFAQLDESLFQSEVLYFYRWSESVQFRMSVFVGDQCDVSYPDFVIYRECEYNKLSLDEREVFCRNVFRVYCKRKFADKLNE